MSPEEELLEKIRFVLTCGNEAQAIRLIEQYKFYQQEKSYSEEEILKIIQNCKEYLAFGDEFDEIEWFNKRFKKK